MHLILGYSPGNNGQGPPVWVGCGLFHGDLTPFPLRAPLGNEVQQDQEDPLDLQGAQDLKVPLEQQERKVSR